MAFGAFGSGFGTPPLGSTPAPFGQPAAGQVTGATPTFGASTPAFGSSVGGAFGSSSAFGAAKPTAGFGATFGSQPGGGLFGTSTPQTGFGATSTFGTPAASAAAPAFGGSSVFGSNPFSSSTPQSPFGVSTQPASAPAFGATSSTPAFGATPGGFGSNAFGSATGAFGSVGFGGSATGTRQIAYSKTVDPDSGPVGTAKNGSLNSISAMPQYQNKQPEELRWEDYQAGVKGGSGVQQPGAGGMPAFGQGLSSGFGAAPTSPFGTPTSTPAFGSGGAFGASTPAFGASTPAFGSSAFGTSTPAFGSTTASAPAFGAPTPTSGGLFGGGNITSSPFGTSSTPAFGGGAFGSTTPAFGTAVASTPAFGATTSTPAFGAGAFGTSTFGSSPASSAAFGALSSTPAFGSAAASTPAFGTSQTPSLFGATPAATPNAFGMSTPAFSFATSTPAPAFGATSTLFGATPQTTPGTGLFGQPATGSLFSSSAFSTTGAFGGSSLSFPASTPGTSLFGGMTAPVLTPQVGQQATTASPLPGVATSPYGTLPAAPSVAVAAVPEHKVGISQRPLGPLVGRGVARPTALLTPRSITPRAGIKLRPTRSRSLRPSNSGNDGQDTNGIAASGMGSATMSDPRHLVVRDALPSTEAASSVSAAPSHDGAPQGLSNDTADRGGHVARRDASHASSGDEGSPDADDADGSPSPRYDQATPQMHRRSSRGLPSSVARRSSRNRTHRLTDDEVSELLPQLDPRTDLALSPTLRQLAVMARDDPESLTNVANFTITRPNVGSIRWLEEVDVTAADIEALVRLTKGGVEVYLDDATKPPVGEGFNRPASITLCNVFKMDSSTKRPSKDADAISRFTTKLKKISAQQGAKFVSYSPETGDWKFEVEHFSRYGLLDDDSSEEDEKDRKGGLRPQGQQSAAGLPQHAGHDTSDDMQQSDDDNGGNKALQRDDSFSDQLPNRQGQLVEGSLPTPSASLWVGRALPAQLPASLALDPGRLAVMRDCFQDDSREQDAIIEDVEAPKPAAAPTLWLPASSAISAPVAPRTWPARVCCRSLTPMPTSIQHSGPSARDGVASVAANLVDAGSLLGQSTRSSWAPSGLLAHASGPSERQRVMIRRMASASGMGGSAAHSSARRQRTHDLLQRALQTHAAHSVRVGSASKELDDDIAAIEQAVPPQWQLKCSREQLPELCLQYTSLCTTFITKHQLPPGRERSCLQQEGWTWDLVRILFEALVGEACADGSILGGDPPSATGVAHLAALRRQAALSRWLQDGVQGHVASKLSDGLSGCQAVLACLIGHQIPAAAAMAAACGDVRLATLIAKAGSSSAATADLEQQLALWSNCDITSFIDSERLQVYEVLAGHVDHVLDEQPDIPWRAALGMHLWYALGGAAASISSAVGGYEASVAENHAAPPFTADRQQHPNISSDSSSSVDNSTPEFNAKDVDLQLLRLYISQSSSNPEPPQPLSVAGCSADPLDSRLAWLLTSVLAALGVMPTTTQSLPLEIAMTTTLIEQLEVTGGLEEWAVYVALHLHDAYQRSRVVTELMCCHAPAFATSSTKRKFLMHLGVSKEALASAMAMHAGHTNQVPRQVAHLIRAGPSALEQARQLAAQHLAPQLLLAERTADLKVLLNSLQCGGESHAGPLALYAHLTQMQEADAQGDGETAERHASNLMQCLAAAEPYDPTASHGTTSAARTGGLSDAADQLSCWSSRTEGVCKYVACLRQSALANDLQLMASADIPVVV